MNFKPAAKNEYADSAERVRANGKTSRKRSSAGCVVQSDLEISQCHKAGTMRSVFEFRTQKSVLEKRASENRSKLKKGAQKLELSNKLWKRARLEFDNMMVTAENMKLQFDWQ